MRPLIVLPLNTILSPTLCPKWQVPSWLFTVTLTTDMYVHCFSFLMPGYFSPIFSSAILAIIAFEMSIFLTPLRSARSAGFWSCVMIMRLYFSAYSTTSLSFAALRPASCAVSTCQPKVSKYSFKPAYISSRRSFNFGASWF